MFVVDTNVISEVMRPRPSELVIAWFNAQTSTDLFVTSITIAEIEFGIEVLPKGRRKLLLERGLEQLAIHAFAGRILPFDLAAARVYAGLMAHRRGIGRALGMADGQVASIARVHGFAVATRNGRDFEECGLRVVNPFSEVA